jgi:hypothetical protein
MQHRKEERRWWRVLGRRRCACGLPWPCIEATLAAGRHREENRTRTAISDPALSQAANSTSRPPAWDTPTMPLFQVARAGALTPGQERRSRGGAPC